jgi:hypothetical protein
MSAPDSSEQQLALATELLRALATMVNTLSEKVTSLEVALAAHGIIGPSPAASPNPMAGEQIPVPSPDCRPHQSAKCFPAASSKCRPAPGLEPVQPKAFMAAAAKATPWGSGPAHPPAATPAATGFELHLACNNFLLEQMPYYSHQ